MNAYSGKSTERTFELQPTFCWYDFVVTAEADSMFRYQLAGHVETGEESRTDPAIRA
jgi:phospholipase C